MVKIAKAAKAAAKPLCKRSKFGIIKYSDKPYPPYISWEISETAAHFDKQLKPRRDRYSLHTEYAYTKRTFQNPLLEGLDEIKAAQEFGIPQLWKNPLWAGQFYTFIERITEGSAAPELIEIHPPFTGYCPTVRDFLEIYEPFERRIAAKFPGTGIVIENRCGSRSPGQFLIKSGNDILVLCEELERRGLMLKVVIDYSQLFSGENISWDTIDTGPVLEFNRELEKHRGLVGGIHLWARVYRNSRWNARTGTLSTLFRYDEEAKRRFLRSIAETFSDGVERHMVLEVNSTTEDLASIYRDLTQNGFDFTPLLAGGAHR